MYLAYAFLKCIHHAFTFLKSDYFNSCLPLEMITVTTGLRNIIRVSLSSLLSVIRLSVHTVYLSTHMAYLLTIYSELRHWRQIFKSSYFIVL